MSHNTQYHKSGYKWVQRQKSDCSFLHLPPVGTIPTPKVETRPTGGKNSKITKGVAIVRPAGFCDRIITEMLSKRITSL